MNTAISFFLFHELPPKVRRLACVNAPASSSRADVWCCWIHCNAAISQMMLPSTYLQTPKVNSVVQMTLEVWPNCTIQPPHDLRSCRRLSGACHEFGRRQSAQAICFMSALQGRLSLHAARYCRESTTAMSLLRHQHWHRRAGLSTARQRSQKYTRGN